MKFETVPSVYRLAGLDAADGLMLAMLVPLAATLVLGVGRELSFLAALSGLLAMLVMR